MNNETIDYTLIRNDKQEIVLNKNCHHWSVRYVEVKFLCIFPLGPRFRVRCPYYRGSGIMEVTFTKNLSAFSRFQVDFPY